MMMFSPRLRAFATATAVLMLIGCGKSQPPEIRNAVVRIAGQPNEVVYLSIECTTVKVDGRSTSETGSEDYGPRTLDDSGALELSVDRADPVHGIDITIVNLNGEPVKLTARADGIDEQTREVAGKLQYGRIEFGYRPSVEPGSPMSNDPEDSVYEARNYLKRQAAKSLVQPQE